VTLPILPALPGVAFPLPRRPIWDTNKADAVSGKRIRSANRTYPTYSFELSFAGDGFLRSGAAYLEMQQLAGFFNSMAGGVGLFRYLDPNDNVVTQNVFGTGDGSSMAFQLARTFGGFTEPIFCPSISQVRINGVATTGYTVDNYGKITFGAPIGAGAQVDWTGFFYFPCRFDDDSVEFSNIMLNLYELKSLKFSSEKLP